MFLKKLTMGVAALGLATAPVMAQADVAATAPVQGENALGGEDNGGIIALIAVLAVIVIGAFTLIDDDDEPISA